MLVIMLPVLLTCVRASRAGLIHISPSPNSAEPEDTGLGIEKQLSKEEQHILLQIISLVKKIGGVSALEALLVGSARNNYRGPAFPNQRRTFISDLYGQTVTEVTVTSPPLILKKTPNPIVLTNFTINIQKLNIDPYSLGDEHD